MGKKKINLLDRPLTIEAVYDARPRLWWLYTMIVLFIVAIIPLVFILSIFMAAP